MEFSMPKNIVILFKCTLFNYIIIFFNFLSVEIFLLLKIRKCTLKFEKGLRRKSLC